MGSSLVFRFSWGRHGSSGSFRLGVDSRPGEHRHGSRSHSIYLLGGYIDEAGGYIDGAGGRQMELVGG